jgi:hypothetical protein
VLKSFCRAEIIEDTLEEPKLFRLDSVAIRVGKPS